MAYKPMTAAPVDSSRPNAAGVALLRGVRIFSVASIILGILGVAFSWWLPFGMVLGLAGLVLGFVDAVIARRRSLSFRLAIVGIVVSAAALALDMVVAALGMQTVTFGGWH
ncbi:MAG TPA: hypothetical protein VMS17_27540 [Gemmataceae bacterium]|nr:hypothetical protein [Gemmataceae bacterium]